MFQEFPKWVYRTDGPQETYEPGTEPVIVETAEEEAALTGVAPDVPARRGRPPKAV